MARTEQQELWGSETRKAVDNFPVSGEPIPTPVARWLGRIKAAAARVNGELGLLDADKAERIAAAADRIANGELDDQFPIDVFQTGSGTSSNMNANEVIATLAGEDVHANDDVNMGQSSNDVFPTAVHLAALDELTNELLPAVDLLAASLEAKAKEFDDVVKSGRTHWMDAVPVTLGQEFGGYAAQVREGAARIANGELDDQFPIDVFQTGSGTSSNMNANEVIATLAGEGVHANDDVNMGQSSNDVFPSAVHLAALDEITNRLLPALDTLAASLEKKAREFDDVVKSGRTHWMDAVPVTLGQEFGGYAAQVRQGI